MSKSSIFLEKTDATDIGIIIFTSLEPGEYTTLVTLKYEGEVRRFEHGFTAAGTANGVAVIRVGKGGNSDTGAIQRNGNGR